MGEIRPWQAVLFVVAILVLGAGLAWMIFGGERVHEVDAITVVDVKTGDLFTIDVSGRAAAMYPEKNPDTGEYTLLPVFEDEDGAWYLDSRARAELGEIEGELPAVLDRSTGQIEVDESSRRRIKAGSS